MNMNVMDDRIILMFQRQSFWFPFSCYIFWGGIIKAEQHGTKVTDLLLLNVKVHLRLQWLLISVESLGKGSPLSL
jgi:hypothetical protein